MRGQKISQGFTLVELLIVIVLMAIFVTYAIPGFSTMVNNNRVQSGTAELKSMLLSARTDAVTKRAAVTVSRDANNTLIWAATQGGKTVSTLTLPATVVATPSVTSITFKPDGTATAANIGMANSAATASYSINVTKVGLIKSVKSTTETSTGTGTK